MHDAFPDKYPIENWEKVLDRYFEIVDRVGTMTITGGEPLTYPDFPALLRQLKKYSEQIGKIQVATNGTVVPQQGVLDESKRFGEKLYFIVDNYGPEVSPKIEEIDRAMTGENVPHIIRNYTKDDAHCGGWVDFGGLTTKRLTDEEAEQLFAKCAYAPEHESCFPITGGEMWPCAAARRRKQLGLSNDCSEYIDLLDDSLSIEEQREKIRTIFEKKSLSACAYCSGLCEDSVRIAAGEQLTREELDCVKAGARSYEEVLSMLESGAGSK